MVIILNISDFFSRIDNSLQNYNGINGGGNRVNYFDPAVFNGVFDRYAKRIKYAYEEEWRLVMDVPKKYLCSNEILGGKDPFVFNIGSIRDIARKINTDDFVNEHDLIDSTFIFS